ncbi:PLG [Mytilus edulis]|uniref:PLG n=1 Tax=Mytilus edulis TaxID=6550 RepID=A0A8S3T7Y5_MYTED|nr:PLG [Mytilus edulis]
MMLVNSLQHKDYFNVMPGLSPGNEYLIGVEYAESSIRCASLCGITSTCMTAVLNSTTMMCGLYRQSQPTSANNTLSQDKVLILQKAVESEETIETSVSTMQETTDETVTTLSTESTSTMQQKNWSVQGGQTYIVLNYNDRNNEDSRQWCQENGNMEMIMIKTVTEYNEVINKLTSESVDIKQFLLAVEPGTTKGTSVSTIQETTDETFTTLVTESATITQPKNWTILGAADCYPSTSLEYNGTINYTVSGIPCQFWNTDTPHYRNYLPVDTAAHDTNYCRETNHLEGGPGCYTSNPAVNWEHCYIVKCDACGVDERLPAVPTDTTYLFHVGKFIEMVFTCNTLSPGTSVDHCPVSQCGSDDQWTTGYSVSCTVEDCYTDSTTYQGKVTCTVTGITCDVWTFEGAMPAGPDKNTNYCRDPDNTGAPWCYTTDPNVRWEFCPVRKC